MARQIKFTIGNGQSGYKTVEIAVWGSKVTCKILRDGLLNVDKKNFHAPEISAEHFAKLDALNIFAWEENYSADSDDDTHWTLTFSVGQKIYRGRGLNAYPENFERFLDWLDEFFPQLEFVDRKRLERVTIAYSDETLTLDRREKILTLDKKNSRHIYSVDDIEKIFDTCQHFIDGVDKTDLDDESSSRAKFELVRHGGAVETFTTLYNENFLPGLTNFLGKIRDLMIDLTAEIFTPEPVEIAPREGKYIFCKVQFKGSYKSYTYQADDETLAVGDIVDVPVGRNNDITQAKLVEIGYFDEYEAPFPIDRIKKIIGKHTADAWENL